MNSAPDRVARSLALASAKVWVLVLARIPFTYAAPLLSRATSFHAFEDGTPADDPSLWLYLGIAAALVLSGGAFAGLTIALMGQDEIYLQVIKTSGEAHEKKNAASVLNLLEKGKHWVLVTLLLSNVIVNETLPIVLDRSLGGGWPAVIGSTALIVIFGEVVPQSICVRYGLPIGAWMAPAVLALMYLMAPIAWPIAKLLDKLLGEDHGTFYKKAGLKTLVTLHKNLGSPAEQLNSDEVTIISAVLDLKEKAVGSIMIPMDDVFTMSADTILDETMMDLILSQGYSRIPIHSPDNPQNFVGMLLVKMLITYDPEDAKQVRDFALATLPETRAETSCLDIVNFFQEGKSHMVLVSEYPGEDHGALGVVTLEDVIEELIGEEIIDESDVFIDVHKAIRRMTPAPKSRVPKGRIVAEPPLGSALQDPVDQDKPDATGKSPSPPKSAADERPRATGRKGSAVDYSSPPQTTFYLRRTQTSDSALPRSPIAKRGPTPEIRQQLKHLGPSNLASRPRETRYNNVKIKRRSMSPTQSNLESTIQSPSQTQATEASSLLANPTGVKSAGKSASDAVRALKASYGTTADRVPAPVNEEHVPEGVNKGVNTDENLLDVSEETPEDQVEGYVEYPVKLQDASRTPSGISTSTTSIPPYQPRGPTRSGSITEQIIDSNGIRKVILQASSSHSPSDEDQDGDRSPGKPPGSSDGQQSGGAGDTGKSNLEPPPSESSKAKKKRSKKKKKNKKGGKDSGETQPLLQE